MKNKFKLLPDNFYQNWKTWSWLLNDCELQNNTLWFQGIWNVAKLVIAKLDSNGNIVKNNQK